MCKAIFHLSVLLKGIVQIFWGGVSLNTSTKQKAEKTSGLFLVNDWSINQLSIFGLDFMLYRWACDTSRAFTAWIVWKGLHRRTGSQVSGETITGRVPVTSLTLLVTLHCKVMDAHSHTHLFTPEPICVPQNKNTASFFTFLQIKVDWSQKRFDYTDCCVIIQLSVTFQFNGWPSGNRHENSSPQHHNWGNQPVICQRRLFFDVLCLVMW